VTHITGVMKGNQSTLFTCTDLSSFPFCRHDQNHI